RLRRRADGRLASPFRGWWYWHHIAGLVFGVLTLTWVFSGLMTMNPWGTLSGAHGVNYGAQIAGGFTWGEMKGFLAAASRDFADERAGQLRSAPFDGRLYVLAARPGAEYRLDADAGEAALSAEEVAEVLGRRGIPVAELGL